MGVCGYCVVSSNFYAVVCFRFVLNHAVLRLLLLAIPMILFPNFLLYISETGYERRNILTPLESFLVFHSGILLVAFAMGLLFNVCR